MEVRSRVEREQEEERLNEWDDEGLLRNVEEVLEDRLRAPVLDRSRFVEDEGVAGCVGASVRGFRRVQKGCRKEEPTNFLSLVNFSMRQSSQNDVRLFRNQ